MQPDTSVIDCRGVGKSYGDGALHVEVLKELDLQVNPGESLAVVGVSGSGKSTLLHLLGGLDAADCGELLVCGKRLKGLSETGISDLRNRHIGFVYQFHHLLGDFTVIENVVMPLLIRGERFRACRARGLELLERTGLKERAAHKPHELSGGERQRAAVCRALITRPSIVLADEPTGQLDRETAGQVTGEMFELNRSCGAALIFATHDERLASRLDRVERLEGGCLHAAVRA